jgi:NADPH2:quinone reductase
MIVATSKSAALPLTLMELPSRALEPDEIRVSVRSIAVNPVDWKMRRGGPLRLAHRFIGPSGPLVVGVDFAGEISEIGPRVQAFAVGTRVVGATDFARKQLGSYASEVVVKEDQLAALPESLSFDDAACLPVAGATAHQALIDFAHVDQKPGASVLILGASGGVGLCTIQLARKFGAKAVGVCSTTNVALVESLGAKAIDYTRGDALAAARSHGPYDLVLHAVGTLTYPLAACRALLKPDGTVALVVQRVADYFALATSRNVRGSLGRARSPVLDVLVAAAAAREITPIIEATFPLGSAELAHERSSAGKVVGKLLLHPSLGSGTIGEIVK